MATTVARDVTFDSVLRVLMPPGERSFVRLAVGPAPDEAAKFYRRIGNSWCACDGEQGGVWDFVTAHSARGMKFSPIGWSSYSVGSPMIACWALWSSVAGEPSNGAKRSIVIDEGDRIVALWLLRSPIYDLGELKGLLERLRRVHGGDPSLADPRDALIAIPGSKCPNVVPPKMVTVVAWGPTRPYDVGEVVQ
jgi:hypothetical protein